MNGADVTGPSERYLRRQPASELDRQRFDRAKRFVDETVSRGRGDEIAHRMSARWLKFLCSRTPIQANVWPEDTDFLRHFATVFGVPPAERRKFLGLSLLGRLWRALYLHPLDKGPPQLVPRLPALTGGGLVGEEGWGDLGSASRDGRFTVIEGECLGACGFVTPIMVNDEFIESVTPEKVPQILTQFT